jgi:hypothetical protein
MIEREYIKLFAISVGLKVTEMEQLQETIEKAIYSRGLDMNEEKACEKLLSMLQEKVVVVKGQIPIFRRIVYSVWYGI